MKRSLDEQGFTILELMVGSAILMIACYAVADAVVLNSKAQRSSQSESEINMLFSQVQSIAGAEWSCTASLSGSNYTGAIVVKDPVSSALVASEGMSSSTGNFWSVTQVRMQNVQAVPGQAGVLRGSLLLQASKNMSVSIGSPMLSRSIQDIYFEANPDGTIARCYTTGDTVAAAQSTCQLLGGTWSGGLPGSGGQCVLKST